MKNLVLTLVMIIGSFAVCNGNEIDQPERTVIAINGLNMRETPTLNGKVMEIVPFLDKVSLLSEASSQTDTLSTVNFTDYDQNIYPDYIVGEWVKIKYLGREGYVFNAYLMEEYMDEPLQRADSPYGITFAGLNCVNNIHRNKELQWKGVFKNGDQFELRDVELEYYIGFDELGVWYGTTTKDDENPLFMIGAMDSEKFQNGKIDGKYLEDSWVFDYSKDSSSYENLTMHISEHEAVVTIKEGSKQQKLEVYDGLQVIWKGDLDGDGKDDYLFISGEESSSTTLYLSSEADEDEKIVKPIATYYSGYCC